MIARIDLSELLSLGAQMERHGVVYGYGAKAEGGADPRNGHRWNPRSTGKLSTPISTIDAIDCSGFFRYGLYHATDGKLVVPDGSQAQREWCEQKAKDKQSGVREIRNHLKPAENYRDAARYVGHRLFACFIRPFHNGCGAVGHVFFLTNTDADANAETLESCGGRGVCSRNWDTGVLLREIYSVFELPVE